MSVTNDQYLCKNPSSLPENINHSCVDNVFTSATHAERLNINKQLVSVNDLLSTSDSLHVVSNYIRQLAQQMTQGDDQERKEAMSNIMDATKCLDVIASKQKSAAIEICPIPSLVYTQKRKQVYNKRKNEITDEDPANKFRKVLMEITGANLQEPVSKKFASSCPIMQKLSNAPVPFAPPKSEQYTISESLPQLNAIRNSRLRMEQWKYLEENNLIPKLGRSKKYRLLRESKLPDFDIKQPWRKPDGRIPFIKVEDIKRIVEERTKLQQNQPSLTVDDIKQIIIHNRKKQQQETGSDNSNNVVKRGTLRNYTAMFATVGDIPVETEKVFIPKNGFHRK